MIARAAIPATIGTLPRREALAFLSLFFVPGVAQAILLTVVPLEALYLLDSARAVTLLYVGTGLVAVAGRFSIPYLVRLLRRRFVFTLGTLSLAASSILLAFNQVPALAVGLVLITFAFACIEITSQLYVLDHVPRQALKHFEPIRIFAIAGPWTLGPWLGVYLQRNVAFVTPFAIAAGPNNLADPVLVAAARRERRAHVDAPTATESGPRSASLLRPAPSAPSLDTGGRALLVVEHVPRLRADLCGHVRPRRGNWRHHRVDRHRLDLAGAVLGLGWPTLRPAPLVAGGLRGGGRSDHLRRRGTRHPWLGAVLLVLAALGTETSTAPATCCSYARSAFERSEMTTVFVSFRDAAQLGPPVVCSLLLSLFNLSAVFIASGVMMVAASSLARRIPRRL